MTKIYEIKDSSIHGKGVFAAEDLKKGDRVGLGIQFIFGLFPSITGYLGCWVNHCSSAKSNLILVWDESDEAYYDEGVGWYFEVKNNVLEGTELLLDYADTPFYIEGPQDYYTC